MIFVSLTAMVSCGDHFINDTDYRKQVEKDFTAKREALDCQEAFGIFRTPLATDEREALKFLYAYMPIGDILNHDGKYYLENYRLTKEALAEMPWGKTIPEREIRHFILPVRVNNENLDTSRAVFFNELKDRVKGMSMYDAVLEVNHWCHEKAIYMPSDSRTSSPLATVMTAYGRCGEESTLLVAALRSVAIPARQVYTPRWAHTDDNHAWVEAWVDGEWYFLGACEPEPVLDLGWFNAPASRGMLMHTNVFGRYDGPEDVMRRTPMYTEINVIENYAPAPAEVRINVVETDGTPASGARVEYKLYNYAEFYTVASKTADDEGRSSLTAGRGDLMVLASKDGRFGLTKVSFGKDSTVTITLDKAEGDRIEHMSFEIVPPAENANIPEVTPEQRAENDRRMAYEDSIRNAYTATFFTKKSAEDFAAKYVLSPERAVPLLIGARGNFEAVSRFLGDATKNGLGTRALELLEVIAEKDLRDTPYEVLADHLYNTDKNADARTVLNPRVTTELLYPYREYLQDNISVSDASIFRKDPSKLVEWCRDSLKLLDTISMRYVQVNPERVWDYRIADKESRKVFFVSAARSLGIPAWVDEVTGGVKYMLSDSTVMDVDFDAQEQTVLPTGTLKLDFSPIPMLDNPKYYTHFTISKYDNGSFRLLSYPESATWADFKDGAELECGYYMLVSGSRMAQGNVLTDVEFFTINEGETTETELKVREDPNQFRVIGSFNSEAKFKTLEGEETSVLLTTGRGYFIVGVIDYGHEPTNHALKDIIAAAEGLEEWGRPIVLLFASQSDYERFNKENFEGLPSTVYFGIDADGSVRAMMAENMKAENGGRLPMFVLADTFNRVVFFSQGYTIGLGDQLMKVVKGIQE